MTQKRRPSGRIPAEQLPAFKRWALPRVDSAHVVTSPFQRKEESSAGAAAPTEELDLSTLTVDALEKLRADAQREGLEQGLREGRAQGEQEGRQQGQEAGYQAAYADAKAEIDDLKARLGALAQQLERPLQQQHDELEAALLRLVEDVSRAVVGRELETRPELLRDAVMRALEVLPQEPGLSFSVHPDDEALLQELREREHASWEIRTDVSLQPGGLIARGVHSYLDYRVEGRFNTVIERLLQEGAEQAALEGDDADDH